MPRGPLGFPRLTNIGPLVRDTPEPVHNTDPGDYPFRYLKDKQGITADDTLRFVQHEPDVIPREFEELSNWRYGKYPFEDIVMKEGFIPTLSNYIGEDHKDIEIDMLEGDFPQEDIPPLFAGHNHSSTEEIAMKISNDVLRANEIVDEITSNLEYWPPTFIEGSSTMDGAHRTAALYNVLGGDGEIYAWELTNPEDVRVMF